MAMHWHSRNLLKSFHFSLGSPLYKLTLRSLETQFDNPIQAHPVIDNIMWPFVYFFQASWLLCVCYALLRKTTTVQTKSVSQVEDHFLGRILYVSKLSLGPSVFAFSRCLSFHSCLTTRTRLERLKRLNILPCLSFIF